MKNNLIKPLLVLSFFIALVSCGDDDLMVPKLNLDDQENEEITENTVDEDIDIRHFTTTSLSDIEKLYDGEILEFSTSSLEAHELLTSGYVISSDASQNITQQIFIQDQAENPTMGVVIHVASEHIYNQFQIGVGHEIQLKLQGLGLQKINNIYHIGKFTNGALSAIPEEEIETYILKTIQTQNIVPKPVTIAEILQSLDPESTNEPFPAILVSLDDVQLIDEELGSAYGKNAQNRETQLQAIKTLIDCNDHLELSLQNSGSSSFSEHMFPELNGSITGILYGNRLIIRDTNDVDFTQERCQTASQSIEEGILFSENFESISTQEELIALEGWKNINTAQDIPVYWLANAYNDNVYAEIRKGGENEAYESWLITKPIEINNSRQLKLSLDINITNRNSDNLDIFIVDDVTDTEIIYSFENNINMVPQTENAAYEFSTIESVINIPENLTSFRIGFRYKKILYPTLTATTAYKIDNILITEE
ncbi:choice-of-anchor J domain-containing protein [Tamlana sp. s12]|uniref:DUF5689 domain-containing protein n=1 Tax=Tamlana sp. s12 TaxID=1630406 RepID=UPI0008011937|nr:DUF5689 domain-containing protein [Tamlana sp. s12]OBQ56613.1 hypothetical protein VQ01_04545 [Tamlana sp. s12]QQY81745.1 choice-of-anchor J domain-containing protein [Tamlana sp. s12]